MILANEQQTNLPICSLHTPFCYYREVSKRFRLQPQDIFSDAAKARLPAKNGEKAGKYGWSETGNRRVMSGRQSPQPLKIFAFFT